MEYRSDGVMHGNEFSEQKPRIPTTVRMAGSDRVLRCDPQYSNTPILQHSNSPPLHHATDQPLHFSLPSFAMNPRLLIVYLPLLSHPPPPILPPILKYPQQIRQPQQLSHFLTQIHQPQFEIGTAHV